MPYIIVHGSPSELDDVRMDCCDYSLEASHNVNRGQYGAQYHVDGNATAEICSLRGKH